MSYKMTATDANPASGNFVSGDFSVNADGQPSHYHNGSETYIDMYPGGFVVTDRVWREIVVFWTTATDALTRVQYCWVDPALDPPGQPKFWNRRVIGATAATGGALVAPAIVMVPGLVTFDGLVLTGLIDGSQRATLTGTIQYA